MYLVDEENNKEAQMTKNTWPDFVRMVLKIHRCVRLLLIIFVNVYLNSGGIGG